MITFLIAWKDLMKNRPEYTSDFLELLDGVKEKIPTLECNVMDYGSTEDVESILEPHEVFNYFYVEPSKPEDMLNSSKCFNCGTYHANNPLVATISTDLRFSENYFEGVEYFFSKLGSITLRPQCVKLNRRSEIIATINSPTVIPKDILLESDGWDERMYGWGREDDDIVDRLRSIQHIYEVKVNGFGYYHLWHPTNKDKREDEANRNHMIYVDNQKTNGENVLNSYW